MRLPKSALAAEPRVPRFDQLLLLFTLLVQLIVGERQQRDAVSLSLRERLFADASAAGLGQPNAAIDVAPVRHDPLGTVVSVG